MLNKTEISKSFRTVLRLVMALVWILPGAVAQQPVVTIQSYSGCNDVEVSVPVVVRDFTDVSNFTFYIEIDTTSADFISVDNPDPTLLTGSLVANLSAITNPIIVVTWYSMTPASVSDGLLFNLRLRMKGKVSALTFGSGCEVGKPDLSLFDNVVYSSGQIVPFSTLSPDPVSYLVIEGNPVHFGLPLLPDVSYRWQEKVNETWQNLSEEAPYSGVFSSGLTITGVSSLFNGRLYRCMLTHDFCSDATGEATLLVQGAGMTEEVTEQKPVLHVYPNPTGGTLFYTATVLIPKGVIAVTDAAGRVVQREEVCDISPGETRPLRLMNLNNSIYFIHLQVGGRVYAPVKFVLEK